METVISIDDTTIAYDRLGQGRHDLDFEFLAVVLVPGSSRSIASSSAECEGLDGRAGIEELDLEGPIRDRTPLPDQLNRRRSSSTTRAMWAAHAHATRFVKLIEQAVDATLT